jgi:hypothetical protein
MDESDERIETEMVGGIQKTFQSKLSKIDGYLLEMSYI